MKKNLLLRLCLILTLVLVVHSCRTDDYYYQQTDSENQFQNRKFYVLNAKEVKGIPGLWEKVHNIQQNVMIHNIGIKAISKNNQDSLLQGGTIDTDSVLVIENNGSKTYTFKITRDSASPIVENLVLKKNEDESFSGIMLKYNFTEQEKKISSLGHAVDFTNKIEVFPIENLNISARVVSQISGCYTIVWETGLCSAGLHSYGQSCNLTGDERAGVPQVISVTSSCAVSTITEYTDGQPSGGGYDTGAWGTGGGSGDGEEEILNTCEKLNRENLKLKEFFQKTKFQGRLTDISTDIATNTAEKSFSFGVGTSVSKPEAVTPIKIGYPNVGNVSIAVTYPNMRVYGALHTHPKFSEYRSFSASDLFMLGAANKINPDFQYFIVKAYDGSVYGLVITDWSAFRNFFDNKSKDDYTDAQDNFKITSDIGEDISEVLAFFKKQGKTKNEAYELAMAFVLKKYNMGLGLSKMDSNGDFKPLFVNDSPNPQSPKKNIYEQTDNCNL
ncbi:hypothetical protein [Chryseobacterium mulctrae]|uniref:hypothetical protein n=1 Tax=Chryseobacterium mulctrae TaxID=2576777 RepID=UPI001115FA9A|nr:hypothetical protein [Chryseobacterium mulctrae]